MRKLVVVGASGHGKVVATVAEAAGFDVIGFVDRAPKEPQVLGRPVLDLASFGGPADVALAVAIGNPSTRARVTSELASAGYMLPALVHPSVVLGRGIEVGAGAVLMAGVVVNVDTVIEAGAIVNTGARVDHDSRLGAFSHVCPGTCLAGDVHVGRGSWIGIGSSVIQGIRIGAWAMIGAGSVVVRHVPDEVIAFGSPCTVRENRRYFPV